MDYNLLDDKIDSIDYKRLDDKNKINVQQFTNPSHYEPKHFLLLTRYFRICYICSNYKSTLLPHLETAH